MPTLGDLQTRISTEMTRDDLGDVLLPQLNQTIVDAINEYSDERFWFNEARVTGTLAAGAQYTTLPSGYQAIDKLYAVVGSVSFEVYRRSMDYIEALYANPQSGQPIEYAVFAGQARLWPTPNVAYPAIWLTISQVQPTIPAPSGATAPDPATSNTWTNEGQRLICARAKELLYRNVFKDWDAAAAAKVDVAEAYAQLKGFSNQSIATGKDSPVMVTLNKEAGIPPWGGRLVLQLQRALSGVSAGLTPVAAADLPAPTAALVGAHRFVTDGNVTTFYSVVTGGGSSPVPTFCDGVHWRVG